MDPIRLIDLHTEARLAELSVKVNQAGLSLIHEGFSFGYGWGSRGLGLENNGKGKKKKGCKQGHLHICSAEIMNEGDDLLQTQASPKRLPYVSTGPGAGLLNLAVIF